MAAKSKKIRAKGRPQFLSFWRLADVGLQILIESGGAVGISWNQLFKTWNKVIFHREGLEGKKWGNVSVNFSKTDWKVIKFALHFVGELGHHWSEMSP